MKVIGLTGGIGSGKSTVATLLQAFGAVLIDADELARRAREPGSPGHLAILARFQTDDRAQLRKILTESPQAKKDLEAILHPLIREASTREIERLKKTHPEALCIIYEATLLIEAGRADDFDLILVVTSPIAQRIQRIGERDKVSPEQALALIETQNSDEFRLAHADLVVVNDEKLPDLEKKVRKVLDQIISA